MKKILIALSLLLVLTGCGKADTYTDISLKKLETKLENKESFVLVVGSETCSACQEYKSTLNEVVEKEKIDVFFIDLNEFNQEDSTKFNEMFTVNSTPTTLFIQNGEEKTTYNRITGAAGYSTLVNKLKYLGFIKSEEKILSEVTYINFETLKTKINNKETFPLVFSSKSCSSCISYAPTLNKIVVDRQMEIFVLELTDLNPDQSQELNTMFEFKYTPTTVFIEKGSEKTRFDGSTSYEIFTKKLDELGYGVK